MLKKLLLPGLTIGALVVGAAEAQSVTLTVDNFNEGASAISVDSFDTVMSDTQTGSTSNILGGEREVMIEYTGDEFGFEFADLEITAPDPGQFNVANGDDANSVTMMTWDGVGDGSLGTNLSPFDQFTLDVINTDQAGVTITLDVISSAGTSSSILTIDPAEDPPGTTFEFPFSGFSGSIGGILEEVKLTAEGPDEFDLTFDNLLLEGPDVPPPSTPEPSVILGSVLALGLGAWSKKKKN